MCVLIKNKDSEKKRAKETRERVMNEIENYRKDLKEYIERFLGIINEKMKNNEIQLKSLAIQDLFYFSAQFVKEACELFDSILNLIEKQLESKRINSTHRFLKIFKNITMNKEAKFIAAAFIIYLLAWKNIRKRNLSAVYRKDVMELLKPISLHGLDKIFNPLYNLLKNLENYGPISGVISRKKISTTDFNFILKRYLEKYVQHIINNTELTKKSYDKFIGEINELYNKILNSIDSIENKAVLEFYNNFRTSEPRYIAGAIVYYLLELEEIVRLVKDFNQTSFSEELLLNRKRFSDTFRDLQDIIKVPTIPTAQEAMSQSYINEIKRKLNTFIKVLKLSEIYFDKSIEMYDAILKSIYASNIESSFSVLYKELQAESVKDPKYITSALLYTFLSINAFEKGYNIYSEQAFAKKLGIKYSRLSTVLNILRHYLKKIPQYAIVVLNLIPTHKLDDNEYKILFKYYVKYLSRYFKNPEETERVVIRLFESIIQSHQGESKFKTFLDGIRRAKYSIANYNPVITASVLLLVYFLYYKEQVIQQKEFVKSLNVYLKQDILYHSFNDLYYYISITYFKNKREEYKKRIVTTQKFFHRGQIYKFKVIWSKLQNNNIEISKGLTYLIRKILKKEIPQSFFKGNAGYRASDLKLKGDKLKQLHALPRGNLGKEYNIRDNLINNLGYKKYYDSSYELCVLARRVINEYKENRIKPPDDSFHGPINNYILENFEDAVAVETPIWKKIRNNNSYFTGHIDLIIVKEDKLQIVDYKKDIYEIFHSIPQLAAYGVMMKDRISNQCDLHQFEVSCLGFCEEMAFEFDPELIRFEVKDFIEKYYVMTGKHILIKGTSRKLIDDIEKLLS